MRRGPALLQANRQPACPYPIIVPKQLQIATYPMIGPKASNPDQVVRLPQLPRQQPGGFRIVFEVFLLRVPMQRSTELGGDGTQMVRSSTRMANPYLRLAGCITLLALWAHPVAGAPRDLRVGVAGHAFDHMGSIGDQAEAA